jgi:DNA-binding transcriptional regulator YiaG
MIRDIRDDLKITQKEFAFKLGITTRSLRDLEMEKKYPNPTLSKLLRVAIHYPEVFLSPDL